MKDEGCAMYDVRCTMYDVGGRMKNEECTMSDVQCTMYDVGPCTLYFSLFPFSLALAS